MRISKNLVGLALASLLSSTYAADILLTMNSYGNVRVGMNVDEAYRELKRMGRENVAKPESVASEGCDYYYPYDKLGFMTNNRRVVRIETQETNVVTPSGIRVGDAVPKVKAKFASRLSEFVQPYTSYSTLLIVSNDGKTAMQFEANQRVYEIYAGYEKFIHFVEGC